MAETDDIETLEKRLGLRDVYTICVGAMFSSGFFFLPGVAAANTGPSVVLAYAVSAVLMLPALYSIAELASAMPRAGGAYFFIHRSLGPWFGVMGGVGLWLVLVLKSAFALVGMGAYVALYFDVPMKPLAVALTVAFGLLNTVGVKGTARLQNLLVFTLVPILAYFVAAGFFDVGEAGIGAVTEERFTPFFAFGTLGFVSTVGLVSISYAGLTKIASAAEEVRDVDRNIPLGMLLSLATAATIYVGGVYIMVAVIPPDDLRGDLTPVATAGEEVLHWLPADAGIALIVIAAIASFASTGNAGILTASRYPLAMARDQLVWRGFERLGRFATPTRSIVATCVTMIAIIVFLDVESLAKLGSAFILLTFAMISLAVIIMRESKIKAYAPGYRTPLYPWMQIAGIVSMLGLIATLGVFAILFVVVIVVLSSIWYRSYVKERVEVQGAIFSYLRRLGQLGESGVNQELWRLLQERGSSEEDTYEELVTGALTQELVGPLMVNTAVDQLAEALAPAFQMSDDEMRDDLARALENAITPEGTDVAIAHAVLEILRAPLLVLVRIEQGLRLESGQQFPGQDRDSTPDDDTSHARSVGGLILFFSPDDTMTQHFRILAEVAAQVENPAFTEHWNRGEDQYKLREALLRRDRFVVVEVGANGAPNSLDGRRIADLDWPVDIEVALLQRDGRTIFPSSDDRLQEGDRMTVIGPPELIEDLIGPNDSPT